MTPKQNLYKGEPPRERAHVTLQSSQARLTAGRSWIPTTGHRPLSHLEVSLEQHTAQRKNRDPK